MVNNAIHHNAHFLHEENYLQQVKYPRLDEHIEYHQELLSQANKIKTICEELNKNSDLMGCLDALEKFLVDDIISGDIEFKSFLEYNGHIKRAL